jgi:GTP cyclohydrolase FolE2
MSREMSNVEFAKENETFAEDIGEHYDNKNNWIVTVRFYSLVHYVEETLSSHGYTSRSHDDREDNILNCRYVDDKVRKLYRRLYDVSRDARYECVRLNDEDVKMSKETLEEGKNILGYSDGGSTHKYSV